VDSLAVLLVLDGFDEISSATARDSIIEGIRQLVNHLEASRIMLTSRTGEFNYHIEKMSHFEIHPLTEAQITTFASRWLGASSGEKLVSRLRLSPFADTAIRPLTIAHLCAIYERTGSIPEKPKTVYRKIVSLLLEKWDEQRSVKRVSSYGHFDVDRKLEFLAHLSYVLTASLNSTIFTRPNLIKAYERIHETFALPSGEATRVVQELESHTGLFIESGVDTYEFSHKSLQEYLAAEFIVRLPSIPHDSSVLLALPNELAIATSISSRPSEYLAQLALERFPLLHAQLSFIKAFIGRLLLERPDFEQNPRTTASLLSLYSEYVRAGGHASPEELNQDFDALGRLVKERIRDAGLLKGFRILDTVELAAKPDKVIRLTRLADDGIPIMCKMLPANLWVLSSLLEQR
jgi:hypothetical protein